MLCFVDEVFRGTNTVERIAASSAVLRAMANYGTICLAATHDIELCDLLQDAYDLYHFEDQFNEHEMQYYYVIRRGKATSTNAIHLLWFIGFDKQIVDKANARANHYLKTGAWRCSKS